jgi:predicted nucleic acid-binding protein
MKYILDTCVVSELVRTKPEPKVVQWISQCDEETLFLSVVTIGEIQKGIARLSDKKRAAVIQQWLDSELRERFHGRILPVSEEVALTWGIILGETEQKGIAVSSIDGIIGATAITHNLTVVTRNEKDIIPTGARVLNPWRL